MGQRHKAFKSPIDRGYATEWNDDHVFDPSTEFEVVVLAIQNLYINSGASSGGTCQLNFDYDHTYIEIVSGASPGDYGRYMINLSGPAENLTHVNDYPSVVFSLYFATYEITGTVFEFGFMAGSGDLSAANHLGAYFRVRDNHLYGVTCDGVSETETDLGLVGSFGSLYLNFKIDIDSTSVKFYVTNMYTPVLTQTATRPTGAIAPFAGSLNTVEESDNLLYLDAMAMRIKRKTS